MKSIKMTMVEKEDSGDRSAPGLLAHRIMEAIGNGCRLEEPVNGDGNLIFQGLHHSEAYRLQPSSISKMESP